MYDYSTYSDMAMDTADASSLLEAVAGIGASFFVVFLILIAISIVSMWKIFIKAGKPGWASIVPVYNIIVLFQISGLNPWLVLLFIVPFVGFIAMPVLLIMLYIKLAKAFGKGTGFAVGLIFLNVIFMPILAFSDAEYQG